MKYRYFLLPVIIFSIMVFIIDSNDCVVNREVSSLSYSFSYPFFGNMNIDNFISDYLNDYRDSGDRVIIDYDIYDDDNIYYLSFYKYLWNGNIMNSSRDCFVINTFDSSIDRVYMDNWEYDVYYNKGVDKSKKMVALTFDDGPNHNTSNIIDVLNKYNAKATFFVLGNRIKGREDILLKMDKSGMEIGNHTYSHLLLTKYDDDKIRREIMDTNDLISGVIGKNVRLFRPSYGSVNNRIKRISNMPIIIWDIDTLDWKSHNSKKITSRVVNKVRDGDIILMHDIYSATYNAVLNIIPILRDMGYEFVTVDELFYYKGISLENGKVYGYAR